MTVTATVKVTVTVIMAMTMTTAVKDVWNSSLWFGYLFLSEAKQFAVVPRVPHKPIETHTHSLNHTVVYI